MRPRSLRPPNVRRVLAASFLPLLVLVPEAQAGLAPEESGAAGVDEIHIAYWVMLVLATLLALAAIAGLLFAYRRFRVRTHRDPRTARRLTAGRGTVARAAGALGALALGIFVFGVVMSERARDAAADASGEPLRVDVVAQQWLWRYQYPSEREDIATLYSYNELVVPVDTPIELSFDSTDVLHRWFVPALAPQAQAVPGELHELTILPTEEGTYEGRATQFSGTSYPAMRTKVRVVSQEEFERYQDDLAADLDEAYQGVVEELNEREPVEEVR